MIYFTNITIAAITTIATITIVTSSSSIGTATLVGYGLLNYR